MKKIFSLFIAVVFLLSLSACAVKIEVPENIPEKEEPSSFIEGKWEIVRAEFENSKNPLNAALVSVLKNEIKKGDTIIFSKDNKGKVGNRDITYELKGDRLTITWDESKNFTFEISYDDGRLEMEIDDVIELEGDRK